MRFLLHNELLGFRSTVQYIFISTVIRSPANELFPFCHCILTLLLHFTERIMLLIYLQSCTYVADLAMVAVPSCVCLFVCVLLVYFAVLCSNAMSILC